MLVGEYAVFGCDGTKITVKTWNYVLYNSLMKY